MAAGGDLGASIGPQYVGVITDAVINNEHAVDFASNLGITVEQFGMKAGMLAAIIFPLAAVVVYAISWKSGKKEML